MKAVTRVDAVNTRLGTEAWTPVILITRPVDEQELAGMYRCGQQIEP